MSAPTVGRVVHYYPEECEFAGGGPVAAFVTGWSDQFDAVCLVVFPPSFPGRGTARRACPVEIGPVPFAEEPTPGHWSWPPRVNA